MDRDTSTCKAQGALSEKSPSESAPSSPSSDSDCEAEGGGVGVRFPKPRGLSISFPGNVSTRRAVRTILLPF